MCQSTVTPSAFSFYKIVLFHTSPSFYQAKPSYWFISLLFEIQLQYRIFAPLQLSNSWHSQLSTVQIVILFITTATFRNIDTDCNMILFINVTSHMRHGISIHPATRLFVMQLLQTNNKEYIKSLHCCSFMRDSTGNQSGDSPHQRHEMRKAFPC